MPDCLAIVLRLMLPLIDVVPQRPSAGGKRQGCGRRRCGPQPTKAMVGVALPAVNGKPAIGPASKLRAAEKRTRMINKAPPTIKPVFHSTYQGGPSVEVRVDEIPSMTTPIPHSGRDHSTTSDREPRSMQIFSPNGTNPTADWKVSGHVQRSYDKSVRG
jgi:hypothetical protein